MSGTRPAFYWKVWMRLNWSPYPVLSNARPVTCRYKSGLVSTEQVQGWSTTWRTGCKIWRTLRIYSQSLFSARVCWTQHLAFCALVGDVYVIFEIWRKFSAFPLILQQSIFPSEASQDFLCSGHLRPWMWKSKYVVIFVWFFFLSPSCTSFFVWCVCSKCLEFLWPQGSSRTVFCI